MRWVAGLFFCFAVAAQAHAEGIEWRTDLEAARKEAARTGKPLMVVFRCVP